LRYLLDLSLYQIQIFIKSAEFKNFTATASFFNTTQSAVSKSIASMESILGFPLFIRNRSKLELTAPGEYLYQEWCGLMPHMESSVVKANMMYEHSLQTLTVGVPDSMENGSQIEYIDHFKERFPEVRLVYHVVPSNQLLPRLETGELDLIVTGIYEKRSLERLGAHYKVYMNLPETVIMHKDNPLAQRENIFMEDLKDEEFIVLSPTDNTSYFERVYLLCSKHGFRPNIELFMPNFRSMIVNLIQTKRGVVLTNQLITDAHHPDLRNFQISGTDAGMLVAWKQENTNKYLSKLLELFPNLAEPSDPPAEDAGSTPL
jgi:DNA-binding transcriptional LysR family regulator